MKFTIQISGSGDLFACMPDGSELDKTIISDLEDCIKPGDCESACQYVVDSYEIEWLSWNGNEMAATSHAVKAEYCNRVYFESDTDFDDDENICEVYIVWQLASDVIEEMRNN